MSNRIFTDPPPWHAPEGATIVVVRKVYSYLRVGLLAKTFSVETSETVNLRFVILKPPGMTTQENAPEGHVDLTIIRAGLIFLPTDRRAILVDYATALCGVDDYIHDA